MRRVMDAQLLENPLSARRAVQARPRLGFLGVGWIGRNRLAAIAKAGVVDVIALGDPSVEVRAEAAKVAPGAAVLGSLKDLLDAGLDGVVIATPSALHAEQAVYALERGAAVFCQKPLGRTAEETRRVIAAARSADLLLGVDLSYRYLSGVRRIHELCRAGALGLIQLADLTFHNAYGPDKPWFYDWRQSGGGCVIDLGIHLVDLALWILDWPAVRGVTSRLFSQGRPIAGREDSVEDLAIARIDLESGATIRLACSWKLHAGEDAIISGTFFGTKGGAAFSNVNGSFYNFKAERFYGTKRELLTSVVEDWGGRAAIDWAERLATGSKYDPCIEHLVSVADCLDAVYTHAKGSQGTVSPT